MATKIASLAVEIGVDTGQLEAGLKRAGLQLKETGKAAETAGQKIGNFAKGFGKFALEAGATALAGAFVVATKAAMELESEFGKIAALTDTPQSAIGELRKEVMALSTELPISAQELSKALYFISSSGFQGADAMDILKASALAATAGLGETKVIADAVTSAMNAYGKGVYSAAKVTDLLTFAVKEGKGEPDELAGSLGRVLPIASQAKVGLEDVAAALSIMTRTGMNADEAATALRGTISALLAPAKQSVGALAEIGLTTQDVSNMLAQPGGLVNVLQVLMERTGGNIEQLDLIIPNIRALTGVLSLAGSQGEEYARVLGEAYKAEGLTAQGAAIMGDTMASKLKIAENSVSNLGVAITEKLLPGLGDAAEAATLLITATDKINAAFEDSAGKIKDSVSSYGEYRNKVLLTARAADLLSDAQIHAITTGEDANGQRLTSAQINEFLAKKINLLTEAEWNHSHAVNAANDALANTPDYAKRVSAALRGVSEGFAESGDLALETKKDIEDSTKAFQDYFSTITTDTLGLKDYNKEQGELRQKAAEVKAQIDELQGSQDKLSQNKLGELKEEYNGLIGKIGETTAAHEESTKRVILGFLEQRLAIDGLTQKEQDVLTGVASKFGLIDDATVNTIAAINGVADSFDPLKGNVDAAIGAIDALNAKILGLPSSKEIAINVTEHYGRTGDSSTSGGSGYNPPGNVVKTPVKKPVTTSPAPRGKNVDQQMAPRASGGMIYPGNAYLVGEQGPERLQMFGNGSGYVTPNKSGAKQGVTIINYITAAPEMNIEALSAKVSQKIARSLRSATSSGAGYAGG
jgi:TP901 family phage tail tape measure protein